MDFFDCQGARLCYHHTRGQGPTVVYLGGFRSSMQGEKALFFEKLCFDLGLGFFRFDYSGHGASSEDFKDRNIEHWLDETCTLVKNLITGPIILIGSSMGAWIMLLLAKAIPERIIGLMGIASAPDFVESLIWNKMPLDAKEILKTQGYWQPPIELGSLTITQHFVEAGLTHTILNEPLHLDCPVHLVHGLKDTDIPWSFSMKICEQVASHQVKVTLIKDGDHRLTAPHHLDSLKHAFVSLLELSVNYG